ncbi:MAG TPA: hypothetical protein VHC90_17850 [Bryobacteraceae bacterium]|nr:hypothetical protein [Bryobacteraceae bacterium]
MCRPIQILLLAGALWAQTSATEPVKVPFSCSEADLAGAGMTCADDNPCPVYLELSSVSADGRKLIVTGDLHGPSATIASVLLQSEDDGVTWKEPAGRITGSALDLSQWLDARHGWAGGEVEQPLSRDPFFMVTSDGGATWRQKEVSEDGIPGELMRFWFDTPEHGELIVDAGRSAEGGRYQMYESKTGGETWTVVSKTSGVPQLRRTPGLIDPDYRIATDSPTKTYVVEKRNGDDWSHVASFAIQVASCGAPPEPAVEEPPDAK